MERQPRPGGAQNPPSIDDETPAGISPDEPPQGYVLSFRRSFAASKPSACVPLVDRRVDEQVLPRGAAGAVEAMDGGELVAVLREAQVGRAAGGVGLEQLRNLAGVGVPDDNRHDGAA